MSLLDVEWGRGMVLESRGIFVFSAKFLAAFFLSLMASGNALAQSAAAQTITAKNCDAFYPAQKPVAILVTGTVLSVHISKDGTLSNPSILKSSGDSALDSAAISCANISKRPQKSSGEPVELDWQATIWSQNGHTYISVPDATICPISVYPTAAVRQGEKGRTTISFSIGADGNPTNGRIVQSAGYPDLDKAALNCLTYFHFPVPTQAGKPIQIDRDFRIVFGLSN